MQVSINMSDKNPGESFYTTEIASKYEAYRKNDRYWKWEDEILSTNLNLLRNNSSIVDCPCGTGRFFHFYRNKNLKITGVDISKDMLFEADKKVKAYDLGLDTQLICSDLNQFNYSAHSNEALVSFRLLHLISPDKVEEYVNNLSKMASHYIFLQVFTVYDFSPKHILKRLMSVSKSNASAKSKFIYLARTTYSILKNVLPVTEALVNRKKSLSNTQLSENNFCDVTYFHSLAVLTKSFARNGFDEKKRFELIDSTHVKNESATRVTLILVLEKTLLN